MSALPFFPLLYLFPSPLCRKPEIQCLLFSRKDGQKKAHKKMWLVSFLIRFLYLTVAPGHRVPQRLVGFKNPSQLKTKQDKTKHCAVPVLLKQQPQPSRETNHLQTTAGGEGGARRPGKARASVAGRFLKSPFVYLSINHPSDKTLFSIKGVFPWLLYANELLICSLEAQKEWKHFFKRKLILLSSCC